MFLANFKARTQLVFAFILGILKGSHERWLGSLPMLWYVACRNSVRRLKIICDRKELSISNHFLREQITEIFFSLFTM